MEEIGMYERPETNAGANALGTFSHPYFSPQRHMAPCNWNATCNMSPVIPDFFVAMKSMQNAQVLAHTNGISKYLCKYIAKMDEGNYVTLCQDAHTGQWVLEKTHLHNTKIVSSKFNEDKAFAQQRKKNLPKGREMPYFEIRQIIMGDMEVYTDLTFVDVSTLPFELRPANTIRLDSQGDVVQGVLEFDADTDDADAYSAGVMMQSARLQVICQRSST